MQGRNVAGWLWSGLLGWGCLVGTVSAEPVAAFAARARLPQQGIALAEVAPAATDLPATKPATILIEGEPVVVVLTLFAEAGLPLVTYYPSEMTPEVGCLEEGCGVQFTGPLDRAMVQFFFPREVATLTELEASLGGENGFLSSSGLTVVTEYTQPRFLRYWWVKKVIAVEDDDDGRVGMVCLGEVDGRVFWSVMLFPPEAGDGFVPLADAILDNVQVRP